MINRKDTSLLVENWRRFINEGEDKEFEPGLNPGEFAEKYLEHFKVYINEQKDYNDLLKYYLNSEPKFAAYVRNPDTKNFCHFLYYLVQAGMAYPKGNMKEEEKKKRTQIVNESFKNFFGSLDLKSIESGTLPSIVYLNYNCEDKKLKDEENMNNVNNYIIGLIRREFARGKDEKSSSPFSNALKTFSNLK